MNTANPDTATQPDGGFSLLEALIALSILAVAAAALIGAAEAHIDRVAGLEDRTVASWVAEDRLAELKIAPGSPVAALETSNMGGRSWQVEVKTSGTDDPELVRVDIAVSDSATRNVQARLSGFIDIGAGQ